MSSVINTNIFSLVAQRNLSSSQGALQTSITRLSSGMRINSAADDAAGLAITDRMSSQINGLTQAQQNANDGISLVQTAAGALTSITDNLQRIRTLAVQATNATNSDSDRAALDQEVQQRLAEINRLATQTQFNGLSVLNGTMGNANFQVGANAGQTISVNLTQSMTTQSIGAVAQVTSTANPLSFTVKDGDLTVQDGSGDAVKVAAGTYNNANDLAAAINTAGAKAGFTANIASVTSTGQLLMTNTDPANSLSIGGDAQSTLGLPATVAAGAAAVTSTGVSSQFSDTLGAGDLTFTVNGIAHDITGTFKTSNDLATAINSANIGVNAFIDNQGAMHVSSGSSFSISSKNADDPSTLTKLGLTAGTYTTGGSLASANVSSVNDATLMLSQIDAAITTVDTFNATLGATQNRFQSTISSLSTTTQNLTSARSGVQDTDYASETANLTRTQILQQAGISMLSQANQLPQQVLKLLQ